MQIIGDFKERAADIAGLGQWANKLGWWIDERYRNQEYGKHLVDAVGDIIFASGARLGRVTIEHDLQSAHSMKLRTQLKNRLARLSAGKSS